MFYNLIVVLSVWLAINLFFRSIRRGKDAERNRNTSVKVQIEKLSRRDLFSNAFRRAERKTRRGLLLLLVRRLLSTLIASSVDVSIARNWVE